MSTFSFCRFFSFWFEQFMLQYVGPLLEKSLFDQLVLHISHCIKIYQRSIYLRHRADVFADLFESCDSAKVGITCLYISMILVLFNASFI